MKKRDIILILSLLIISLAGLILLNMSGGGGGYADVYVGGEPYGRYDLSVDNVIHIENGANVNELQISDGSIYMKSATCPNKLCMKSRPARFDNDTICCVPAGILVVITSGAKAEYDAITK